MFVHKGRWEECPDLASNEMDFWKYTVYTETLCRCHSKHWLAYLWPQAPCWSLLSYSYPTQWGNKTVGIGYTYSPVGNGPENTCILHLCLFLPLPSSNTACVVGLAYEETTFQKQHTGHSELLVPIVNSRITASPWISCQGGCLLKGSPKLESLHPTGFDLPSTNECHIYVL